MSKKATLYSGRRKRIIPVLFTFILLGLMLSIERTVIDLFGQMWGTMLLNCVAVLFSLTGLLGICAGDISVIILYASWSVISLGLNILVVLIYNDIGLLEQKERYLGLLVGNNNYWKTHGINCNSELGTNSSFGELEIADSSFGGGSGVDGGEELEPTECLVQYSIVETVHATVYMLITAVSFILCISLLLCRPGRRNHQVDDYEPSEEFSYVSVAQHYDFPDRHRHKSATSTPLDLFTTNLHQSPFVDIEL